jgi:hypothetical protein
MLSLQLGYFIVGFVASSCNAFSISTPSIAINRYTPQSKSRRSNAHIVKMASSTAMATLDESTTWRLRFSLNGVPTTNGRKVGELFNVDVQFIEEEGFEPPQGVVKQILAESKDNENVRYLKVKNGRWKLSEDPNDRKDGLWVWGLFKEPLYPFMLLQLETEEYKLPGTDENSITPLNLYAQINHKREKDTGEVELEAATLNLREVETINADPFGVAKV